METIVGACIFDLQNVIDEIEKLEEDKQRLMDIIDSHFDNETDVLKCHDIYSALPECALRFKLFKKMIKRTEEMNERIAKEYGIKMNLTASDFEQAIKAILSEEQTHVRMNVQTGTPEVDVDFK